MYSEPRWNIIEDCLMKENIIAINKLAKMAGVSEATIRRDIAKMEKLNILLRNRGKVMLTSNINLVSYRKNININKKQAIGKLAAGIVEDNDILFIDSSTTTLEMAKCLPRDIRLTVITNNLMIALELENRPSVHVIILGGILENGTNTLFGEIAAKNLEGLRFKKAFMGAGGISESGNISYYSMHGVDFIKNIISISDKVIVLADSSKFYKTCLMTVIPCDMVGMLVTDSIPAEIRRAYEEAAAEILLCVEDPLKM